jgi:hypothetical protein
MSKYLYLFLSLLILICGCVSPYYKELSVTFKTPPEIILSNIKNIAILPLDSNYSKKVCNMLISKLIENKYFTVIEREKIDEIIKELKLSLTGLMDLNKVVEVGKLAGVEGFILVSVDNFMTEDFRGVEQFLVPSSDKKSDKVYKIRTPTLIRKANLSVSFRIISVSTSEIILSKTFSEKFEKKYYQSPIFEEDIPKSEYLYITLWLVIMGVNEEPPKTEGEIFNELSEKITNSIVKLISPYFSKEIVYWEDLKIKDQDRIIALIKADLTSSALEEMLKLQKDPSIYKDTKILARYHYNLGLIYEILGDLEKAYETYLICVKLDPTDNHINALNRIRKRIKDREKLKEISIGFCLWADN